MAVVPSGFSETVVASNMTSPVTLDIEESGRIWIAYQDGRIGVIENDALLPNLAYQLDCDGSAEHGLQGIELDPHFEENGYIYVYYTANSPAPHNRLSRLTVDPTTENTILAGSEVVLFDLPNLSEWGNPPWHIGGAIQFAADGTMRVQIGESQQATQSQDLESPLGKIFRINSDGSIPTDNPFYDASSGITWRDYVWARGLRNPFAGDLDPVTGRYFVADVGAGSWEEINDATNPGLNFGWPSTEGMFNPATYPDFTNPVHAYAHSNGCAITGGAFNNGGINGFPEEYQGKFFFSEFCGGEIRVIDPNNPASSQVFATDAAYPMNIEFAPDGSMYYISRGAGAGGAPGIGTGTVRKVQYTADVPPQIVLDPADQLASVGYDVSFVSSAAGSTPLAFQWQRFNGTSFVDILGATSETLVVPDVTLADNGAQFRAVVTNAFGSATSGVATLSVTSDTPPTPMITSPAEGLTYRAGDTINFSGTASDLEDGALGAASMTWRVDFHHNVHSHPLIPPTSGITGGQFTVPTATETASDVWYRINLSVTDSAGLTTTTYRDVFPEKSDFVVETNLPGGGGDVLVDNLTKSAPYGVTGVVNVERTISVPASQQVNGTLGFFEQWIDGVTTRERTIATPEDDTAYVALYRGVSGAPVYLSDLPYVGTPVNSWGPIELDTSNGEDAPGDGNPITLNGVVYDKGLGVHALSEVVYDLAGGFSRFVSDIGVDDENNPGGSVVFQVFGDNIELFNSGLMTNASATQTVNLDVTGVGLLKLVVTDGGDGNGSDHADWAGARLFGEEGTEVVSINFQPAASQVPAGYLPDSGSVFGSRGNGWNYGWSSDHTDVARDRDINADQRLDTLVHFHQGQNWELELPNGSYIVTASVGDAGFPSTHTLNVEGVSYWAGLPLNGNQFATLSQLVTIADGRLTLDMGAAADKSTRLNYIQIVSAGGAAGLLPFDVADITLDGKLSYADVVALGEGWGAHLPGATPEVLVRGGDLTFDGSTDNADWELLNAAWNSAGLPAISLDAILNPIAGDFDRNGVVGVSDYELWKNTFGSSIELAADGNGNSVVDAGDYTIWRDHLGGAVASGGGAGGLSMAIAAVDDSGSAEEVPAAVIASDAEYGVLSATRTLVGDRVATGNRLAGGAPGTSAQANDGELLLIASFAQTAATHKATRSAAWQSAIDEALAGYDFAEFAFDRLPSGRVLAALGG